MKSSSPASHTPTPDPAHHTFRTIRVRIQNAACFSTRDVPNLHGGRLEFNTRGVLNLHTARDNDGKKKRWTTSVKSASTKSGRERGCECIDTPSCARQCDCPSQSLHKSNCGVTRECGSFVRNCICAILKIASFSGV